MHTQRIHIHKIVYMHALTTMTHIHHEYAHTHTISVHVYMHVHDVHAYMHTHTDEYVHPYSLCSAAESPFTWHHSMALGRFVSSCLAVVGLQLHAESLGGLATLLLAVVFAVLRQER